MKNLFITFEQSQKIKSLGFDEPCLGFYDEFNNNAVVFGLSEGSNNAPTYQQVFRWFRVKYELWQCIQKYPTSKNPNRCYYELKGDNINTDKDESPNLYMSGWFDIYEKAESNCLDKLIEIIKTK